MRRIIFSFIAVLTFFFASCQSGPDAQLTNDISSFESSWSSLVSEAGSLSGMVKEQMAKMQDAAPIQAIAAAKIDAKKKFQLDSLMTLVTSAPAKGQEMMQAIEQTNGKLTAMTGEFTAWKDQVLKGGVKAEEAKAKLAEYQTTMDGLKNNLSSMQQGWQQISDSYNNSLAAAQALTGAGAAGTAANAIQQAAGAVKNAADKAATTATKGAEKAVDATKAAADKAAEEAKKAAEAAKAAADKTVEEMKKKVEEQKHRTGAVKTDGNK